MKLECKDYLMKYVIDRFGEDVETTKKSDEYFTVIVEVTLSPTFYGWIFQFDGDMRILTPKKAIGEIIKMANNLVARETL